MLPAQAFLLIMKDPPLSQGSVLPIVLCGNLYSLYEEQRELHNLASEALEKQGGHITVQKQPPSLISYHQVTAAWGSF